MWKILLYENEVITYSTEKVFARCLYFCSFAWVNTCTNDIWYCGNLLRFLSLYKSITHLLRGLSQKFVDFSCNCFISCAKSHNCAYFQRIIYFLSNREISEWYVRSLWWSEQIYNHSNASSPPSEISDTYTQFNRPSTIHMLIERHETSANLFYSAYLTYLQNLTTIRRWTLK